jgi:hypothetical protein
LPAATAKAKGEATVASFARSRSKATFAFACSIAKAKGEAPLLLAMLATFARSRSKAREAKERRGKRGGKIATFALAVQRQPLLLAAAPLLFTGASKGKIAKAKGEAKGEAK